MTPLKRLCEPADKSKKRKALIEKFLAMFGVGRLADLGESGPKLSKLKSKIAHQKNHETNVFEILVPMEGLTSSPKGTRVVT